MVDEADAFSAGQWRGRAVAEIAATRAAGRLPILVGGTGLYLKVLIEGIAPVPRIPTAIRDEARTLHAALGPTAFHAALARLDPAAAARLAPGDRQRVVRAYEVVAATGHPLAEWQAASPAPEAGFDATLILLLPPRAPLYEACDARFLRMLDEGAETEVEALLDRGLDPALPAMRALGVGELARWKRGEITQGNAIAAAQQAIRNYAKRQYTWFKHQIKPGPGQRVRTIDAQFSERILPEVYSFIRH
ncbi:MAG: tRNA (adenosine(37)-N6)-dimethylallyltransferase MiaA, partial [Stellaceae bacterium]